jgi:uncharacterized metal-binding protein YceD (DUF177 family)
VSELSRLVPLGRLPESMLVEATPEECAALTARLGILAVHALSCRFALERAGASVLAQGVLAAEVEQACIVTLEPVRQSVDERFAVRFVPEGQESEDDDPESIDELPYGPAGIDLGEAAAEQLALALDPYPRADGAALDEAPEADAANPFAALRGRRPPPS